LTEALDLDPVAPDVQIAAAAVAFRIDWALDAAAARLREALVRRPGAARIRRRLAECLIAGGKAPEAIATALEAAERDPFSPKTLASVGRVLHFAGEHAQSARMLRAALAIVPDSLIVRLDLAMTLARQGDAGAGCIEMDRALATLEGQAVVIAALGNNARARGDSRQFESARKALVDIQKRTVISPASQELLDTSFGETGRPIEYLARREASAGLVQYLGLTPVPGSLSALVDRVGLVAYFGLEDAFSSLTRARSFRALLKMVQKSSA
jgi:predicted Zn-dependent protease